MGKLLYAWITVPKIDQEKEVDLDALVYAWVNDESTKRAYNSKTDAYRTFKKMLNKGRPPDIWEQLIKEAEIETTRLKKVVCEKMTH